MQFPTERDAEEMYGEGGIYSQGEEEQPQEVTQQEDTSDKDLILALINRQDLHEADRDIVEVLAKRFGIVKKQDQPQYKENAPDQYAAQHKANRALEASGQVADDLLSVNPLHYLGKATEGFGNAIDQAIDFVPGGTDINKLLFTPQNPFGRNDPIADTINSVAPQSAGQLAAFAVDPIKLAGRASKALNNEKAVEGLFRSKLGKLGRGNVPFDEEAALKQGPLRDLQSEKQASDSLLAQKEASLKAQQELLGAEQERLERIELARRQDTKASNFAEEQENRLSRRLDYLETEVTSRGSVGEDILYNAEKTQESDKASYAFDQRYKAVDEAGSKLPAVPGTRLAQAASEGKDFIAEHMAQPGDTKVKRAVKFFENVAKVDGEVTSVKFNELLEADRNLASAIYDEFDPSTKKYTPTAQKLIEMRKAVGETITQAAEKNPGLLSEIKMLKEDYSAYNQKWNPFWKRVKGGNIDVDDIPDLFLAKESRVGHLREVLGDKGLASLRRFRSQQIASEFHAAVKSGGDPYAVFKKNFGTDKAGEANRSLFAKDEAAHYEGLAEDLKVSMNESQEARKLSEESLKTLEDLQKTPEPNPKDFPEPEVKKSSLSSLDRRTGDEAPKYGGKRKGDKQVSGSIGEVLDKLVNNPHSLRMSITGALVYQSHPYLATTFLALGYGPEVGARLYIKSRKIRGAVDEAIKAMGTNKETAAMTRLGSYMSARTAFGERNQDDEE